MSLVQIKDDVEAPYDTDDSMSQADQNAYKMAITAADNDAITNAVENEHFATRLG